MNSKLYLPVCNIFSRSYGFGFFLLFVLVPFLTTGQAERHEPSKESVPPVMEFPDDAYKPVNNRDRITSPAYTYVKDGFFMTQVNVDEEGNNIVGDAANEPSIVFDPTNHDRMAIGWRQFDDVTNNFRQAGIGYTSDGGATWSFDGVINPGVFRSDPVLDADADGNFYYNSLTVGSAGYWCDVYKSEDGGATWDMGTFAQGGDKQWFSVDKSGGEGSGNIYHYWSSASICPPYYFTRSIDNGFSYEDCSDVLGGPYWGTTAIDGNGALYVSGFQGDNFVVAKSSTAATAAIGNMSWDFATEVSLDGYIVGFGGYNCPNPNGLLGQTIISVDSSEGYTHENVYLLCSVERVSVNDPCDVMFSRSTDGGTTWTPPVRINNDEGNNAYQWFGTLSVAPDGRIDVVWLDTRANPGSVISKLYYAASWDGGFTWSPNIPLGEPFHPHVGWPDQDKMGDYFDMYSDESGAHLAWANTLNGEQDVYYAHISPEITGMRPEANHRPFELSQNAPNPFRNETTIGFFLNENTNVILEVFDVAGRKIQTLVDGELAAGKHRMKFKASDFKAGIYYYRMEAGTYSQTRKLIILQ